MKKMAIVCCVSVLLVSLGLAGCTRAKPEAPTPTIVASAETPQPPEPTTSAPTQTQVFTPQPPPTAITLTAEPTVISVTQPSPTVVPSATLPPAAPSTPVPDQFEYTVQWGDTLYSLAQRFNTTVDAIVALNSLPDASYIKVGQVLRIAGTPGPAPGPGQEYVVQAGDTMFSIARRYNTTVEAIQRANGIVNPWYISVGQKLVIPQGGTSSLPGGNTYVVQPGDTLYSIAARFGKNVWDIITANNLSDPYWILVGQVLTIPS
jgi:LysM repeat protein